MQHRVLPADASCEDLEVDASLGFLSGFVQAALQNGAAPYISEADRFDMGAVRPSHQDAAVDHSQGLRFTAYERQGAPEAVSVRTVSRDPSPVRGTPPHPPSLYCFSALPALAWLPRVPLLPQRPGRAAICDQWEPGHKSVF